MINLSLDELKLIAKNRNIKDYKNKSEEDLIQILSEPKPKISLRKMKIKEIKKDFSELRHKLRKSFHNIKNPRSLSTAEIRAVEKNLPELEESPWIKKFYDDDYNDEYKKIKSVTRLFKGFNRDCFKPIKTDDNFDRKK